MVSKLDAYQQDLTNKIIKSLENDLPPWACPWDQSAALNLPMNAETKACYQGSNVLALWYASLKNDFKSRQWLTFLQVKKFKGKVKKGSKSTRIIRFQKIDKKCKKTEEDLSYTMFKESFVFNLDQIEGLDEKFYKADKVQDLSDFEIHSKCEQIIKKSQACIKEHGNKACYIPSLDLICMPDRSTFNSANDFYKTLLHELAHWTMTTERCDRKVVGVFGGSSYAFEELIAELTTVFVSAQIGLDGLVNHSSYIKSWLTALRNDKKYIFQAATQASKATAYIMQFLEEEEQEEEE